MHQLQKAVWSMDPELLSAPFPNTVIYGEATLVYRNYMPNNDPFTDHVPELSIKMENPTYEDLLIASDRLIVQSGDDMHIFVEQFRYDTDNDVWVLVTGS